MSDFRRIFFDAAGGQATADATAFIILDWDWMFTICWWDVAACCCCCCWDNCCEWPNEFPVWLPTVRGDNNAGFIDWCDSCDDDCDKWVCDIHWSDSDSSQGPSLNQKNQKNAEN